MSQREGSAGDRSSVGSRQGVHGLCFSAPNAFSFLPCQKVAKAPGMDYPLSNEFSTYKTVKARSTRRCVGGTCLVMLPPSAGGGRVC